MTHINILDPGASPLDYYGFELRRHRESAGLTQRQLGDIVGHRLTGRPDRDGEEAADAGVQRAGGRGAGNGGSTVPAGRTGDA